jgi:GNAT superfamily N-acetyltransferase
VGWRFLSLRSSTDVNLALFNCGNNDVNAFLKDSAITCEDEGFSRVFLMLSDDNKLIGYYTLGNAVVPLAEVPNKYRRGIPQFPFPVMLIGQFGIDIKWQGKGLSYLLVGNAYTRIAQAYTQGISAFRAVRVDTQENDDEARRFWLKQGFIPFKKSTNSLFLPVMTILKELELP